MDEIQEFLDGNPEWSKYVINGEVQWEALGIDIDIERKAIDFVSDADLFIGQITAIEFYGGTPENPFGE